MEYIAARTNFKLSNTAVTMGKFDGLHLGHRQLIELTVSYKEQGLTAVMFTFNLHPNNLFSEKEFDLIYTEEEKRVKLQEMGMDIMISYPFTEETRNMEPEDFIREVIINTLDAKVLIVGEDFCFGKNRKGNVELLRQYEQKGFFQVIACEKKKYKGEIISSSAIRRLLNKGDIQAANKLLGQPYSIRGEVVHGRKLGRTIGMPTVNLIPSDIKLLPPCGVYAVKIAVGDQRYEGVTNIGYKPTVGEEKYIGVETHIFDMDMNLYGTLIDIELIGFIRPELNFTTIEELQARMKEDISIAKGILSNS